MYCPQCGKQLTQSVAFCPSCGIEVSQKSATGHSVSDSPGQIPKDKCYLFGFWGSIALAVGAFLPIAEIPFMGSVNYFMNGKGDGTIIVGLAAVSLYFTWKQKYKNLWYTGSGSFALMTFTFLRLQGLFTSDPFAEFASSMVQLQFGWLALFAGAGCITYAAYLNRRQNLK
jgi:hypothetical protein